MAKIRLTENELINLLEEVLLIEAMSLDQIYAAHYSEGKRKEVPEDVFYEIANADPTRHGDGIGKYTDWMIRLYRKGDLKLENLYKATQYLEAFHKFKNRIEKKDIGQYQSLPELYKAVKSFLDNPDQSTSKSDEIRKIKEGAEKVYEDDEWLIIIPHTKEAAIEYGKNTQWCTAASKGANYFNEYNREGPLYININKHTGKKYQFHFESESFMDETDSEIPLPIYKTIGLTPGAVKSYGSHSAMLTRKFNPLTLQKINGLNDYYLTNDNDNKTIVKYCDDTGEYKEIYTRSDDDGVPGFLWPHCVNGRFLIVFNWEYKCINLFDIKTKQYVFSKDDNIKSLTTDKDSPYVVCRAYKESFDAYSEPETEEYIYSLDEMKPIYHPQNNVKNLKALTYDVDSLYYPNLFIGTDYNFYFKTIFDIKTGETLYHGCVKEDELSMGGGRTFGFLRLDKKDEHGQSLNPYSYDCILLYDGTIMDYEEFNENKYEILKKWVNFLI